MIENLDQDLYHCRSIHRDWNFYVIDSSFCFDLNYNNLVDADFAHDTAVLLSRHVR